MHNAVDVRTRLIYPKMKAYSGIGHPFAFHSVEFPVDTNEIAASCIGKARSKISCPERSNLLGPRRNLPGERAGVSLICKHATRESDLFS